MNEEKGPRSHAQLGSGRTGGNHWVPKSVLSESLCLMTANHPCELVWGSWDGEALVHCQEQLKSSYWTSLTPLITPTELFWLWLFCWICILKSLYWLGQIHLTTQFPGCPRYSSSTSFFEALCTVFHCYTAPFSLFPCFFSCSLTWFALCCCFLCSCSVISALPAVLMKSGLDGCKAASLRGVRS